MAILEAVPGVGVSIYINGQSVKEYEDDGEEMGGPLAPNTVVKYIEAISDAEFEINVSVLPAFREHRVIIHDLVFQVNIDSTKTTGRYWQDATGSVYSSWNSKIEGFYRKDAAGRTTINPFKFTDIEIGRFATHSWPRTALTIRSRGSR
jgi:hypothetical protein